MRPTDTEAQGHPRATSHGEWTLETNNDTHSIWEHEQTGERLYTYWHEDLDITLIAYPPSTGGGIYRYNTRDEAITRAIEYIE